MSTHERAVELAVAAAGVRDKDWMKRVYENLADIAVMVHPESEISQWAEQIGASARFKVEFRGFEEETPQGMSRPSRLIVNTYSEKAINQTPGPRQNLTGEETIRTPPLWTRPGRLLAQRIKELTVGSEILMYKFIEQDESGDRKFRVLTHFEVLRRAQPGAAPQERQAVEPHPPAAPPDQPPAPADRVPEAHSQDDNKALSALEAAFEALPSTKRVAYGRWAQGHGIKNPMLPEPEQMDAALTFIAELAEKG